MRQERATDQGLGRGKWHIPPTCPAQTPATVTTPAQTRKDVLTASVVLTSLCRRCPRAHRTLYWSPQQAGDPWRLRAPWHRCLEDGQPAAGNRRHRAPTD